MSETIKIEGLEMALSKLDLKTGEAIILKGDGISPSQVHAFRLALASHLPLDVKAPTMVIALYDDQSIETLHLRDGDTVILHGEVSPKQFLFFRENLMAKNPTLRGVEMLPANVTVEVSEKNKWPLE
jgi:hypothetical protein